MYISDVLKKYVLFFSTLLYLIDMYILLISNCPVSVDFVALSRSWSIVGWPAEVCRGPSMHRPVLQRGDRLGALGSKFPKAQNCIVHNFMFALSKGSDIFLTTNTIAMNCRRQARFLCVCHESKTHTVSKGVFHTIHTHTYTKTRMDFVQTQAFTTQRCRRVSRG